MRTVEGALTGKGLRVAVVAARFNAVVADRLLDGALDCLRRHGVVEADLIVVRVPGSFELPLAVKALAASGEHDAVVAIGALIRGATPHFDLLAAEVTGGISRVMHETGVPIAFAVLTCDSLEQAVDRAGAKSGNKGFDAALVAIEMANLMRELKPERPSRTRRV